MVFCSDQTSFTDFTRVLLIIIAIVQVGFFHVCECAVGVDVGDGTTTVLTSIVVHVVMGCIVLRRQMNVDFSIVDCINTTLFVGMDVRFLYHEDPRQHDQLHPNQSFHYGVS